MANGTWPFHCRSNISTAPVMACAVSRLMLRPSGSFRSCGNRSSRSRPVRAACVSKPKCPGGLGTSEPMKTSGIHVSFRRRGAPTALNQAVTVLAQRPRDTVLPDNGLPRVGNRSLTVTAPLRALIIKVAPAAPGLPHSGPRRPTSSYPPEPSGPGENLAAVAIPAARQGPLPAR